eukprot:4308353-Pyramimonas_sp.AAC.1
MCGRDQQGQADPRRSPDREKGSRDRAPSAPRARRRPRIPRTTPVTSRRRERPMELSASVDTVKNM